MATLIIITYYTTEFHEVIATIIYITCIYIVIRTKPPIDTTNNVPM